MTSKGTKVDVALIIAADEPAVFYKSVKAAEVDIEAIDVEDGVYTAAFGPSGEPYNIKSQGGAVVITRVTDEPNQPQELRRILLDFLAAMHIEVDDQAGLHDLLKKCEPYVEG